MFQIIFPQVCSFIFVYRRSNMMSMSPPFIHFHNVFFSPMALIYFFILRSKYFYWLKTRFEATVMFCLTPSNYFSGTSWSEIIFCTVPYQSHRKYGSNGQNSTAQVARLLLCILQSNTRSTTTTSITTPCYHE